jgi:hypothetical protein
MLVMVGQRACARPSEVEAARASALTYENPAAYCQFSTSRVKYAVSSFSKPRGGALL